jgi:hypothetical protein
MFSQGRVMTSTVAACRHKALAGTYNFWGRGNFARMLLNVHSYPNSFNGTLEVRTLEMSREPFTSGGPTQTFPSCSGRVQRTVAYPSFGRMRLRASD